MSDLDPPRLRDGDGDLAELLRQGHADLPDDDEMSRLMPRLDPPPPPPPPPATATPALLKVVGALGVVAAVAGLGGALRAPPTPVPAAASAVSLPPASAAPAAGSADPAAGAPPDGPTTRETPAAGSAPRAGDAALAGAAPAVPPGSPRRLAAPRDPPARPAALASALAVESASPPPPAAPSSTAPDPLLELSLLDRARRQSAAAPAEALALLAEHARLFPRSSFGLEREVITIEALARSGRRSEARDRAGRLLDASPRSAYRERLERLLR